MSEKPMTTKVWRHLELTIEVDVTSSGKMLSAEVLREVEMALHMGCEYSPQQMRMGLLKAVSFGAPVTIRDDAGWNPCDRETVEEDLAELARLKALYTEIES